MSTVNQLTTVTTCTTNSSETGFCQSCNPPTGCTQGFQCDGYTTSPCASGYCCASLYNQQTNSLQPWKVCVNGINTLSVGQSKSFANVSGQSWISAQCGLAAQNNCTTDTTQPGYCTSCNPPTGCTPGFSCLAYNTTNSTACASQSCCATVSNTSQIPFSYSLCMPNSWWPAVSNSWTYYANSTTNTMMEFTCGTSNFFANGTFKSAAISKLVLDQWMAIFTFMSSFIVLQCHIL